MGVTLDSGCKGRDWAEDQPPSADSIQPLADLELQALCAEADQTRGLTPNRQMWEAASLTLGEGGCESGEGTGSLLAK